MSGVETTLHGSMDWSRRLLLLPGSSILSSLKLDLQFFLQRWKFVAFHLSDIFLSIFFLFFHCFSFFNLFFVANLNPRIRNTKTFESAGWVSMFKKKYPIHL